MKIEGDLERQRQEKKEMQIAAVKEKLEQRKKERMRKLKEKQELERAQVRHLMSSYGNFLQTTKLST
jgi:DNA-directed RNA polymerase beta' subunit